MPTSGTVIRFRRRILDSNDVPLGGMTMPADITASMMRDTGTAMVVATETVTMSPIAGSTGDYYVEFTPQNSGSYSVLLQEINVNTGLRNTQSEFIVYAAGSLFLPSYTNAFCAESDIERWLQQSIDTTAHPSDTETPAFAETRAAILMSLCARYGFTVTPSTVTAGSRMEDILRDANAVGAALDYTTAQNFGKAPFKTERYDALLAMWNYYCGRDENGKHVAGALEMEISGNQISLASSHILSGDTTARADEGAPQDIGLQIRMSDIY